MTGKFKPEQLRAYSTRFAQVVTEKFFSAKTRITGKEILSFTPVQQINLFIIRELMVHWEAESARLKSPWFDYEDSEVREALAKFRNTLSNHISVARQDLLPLVEKAVNDTLKVTLSPYDFYADLLETDQGRQVNLQHLRLQIRYLRINRGPMEKLLAEIDAKGAEKLSGKEAFALLDRILEQSEFSPEDPDVVLQILSGVAPLELPRPASPVQKPAALARPDRPAPENGDTKTEAPAAPKKSAPVQTSLYDELGGDSRPTLADDFQKKKISQLRDHLTINQKFMFTKTLFNGDFEMFEQALERLDRMDKLQQADRFLEQEYGEWDRESEEYLEFRQLVERRFLPD